MGISLTGKPTLITDFIWSLILTKKGSEQCFMAMDLMGLSIRRFDDLDGDLARGLQA
jgi:hypothetical protein